MMTFRNALLAFVLASSTGACMVQGRISGQVVASSDPMLAELYPGVWVIEDYNEPVFYADGFYWWYRTDGWHRSTYHTGGWVYVQSAPPVIVRIDRPRAYVHYRGAAGVRVRSGPRGKIIVRDHRDAPRSQIHQSRDENRVPRPDGRAMPAEHPQQQPDRRDHDGDKPDKADDKRDSDKPDKGDKPGKYDKPGKGDNQDKGKGKGKPDKQGGPRHS